jgi:enoyl-CoA hydratase
VLVALLVEMRDGIVTLTFNRPEARNALDPETIVELAGAWEAFERDDGLRVAIVTGAGDAFCSGADLGRLIPLMTGARAPETAADHALRDNPRLQQVALLRGADIVTKPVIAAVNGYAIAGGMELMQATDLRVAADDAVFALQEPKWGLFPLGGSTVRLPRQLPWAVAMELLLTGERMGARDLARFGLLNRVVPRDHVMAEARRLAETIVANGPVAVRAIKRAALACVGRPIAEGLQQELEIGLPVFATEDAREGPRAFKEKRKPRFQGR